MDEAHEQLSAVDPADRVLLHSPCMRPSATCPGKFEKSGLRCLNDCREDCVVGRLARAARSLGYKGV